MRFACCVTLAVSACYAPQVLSGAPCEPSQDNCPTGQMCVAVGSGNFCLSEAPEADAGTDAAVSCYGTGLLGRMCFATAPTGAVSFTDIRMINTAMVGPDNCSEIRAQVGGPSLCVIAASTIEVTDGAIVLASGANPLVLVASHTLRVSGTLDAASHRLPDDLGTVVGAGARAQVVCDAPEIEGTTSGNSDGGGGGGAGGSFGGAGGTGGNGRQGAARGNPGATSISTTLVGGCPGGRGGNGQGNCDASGPCGGGLGGDGGGALYLIAGDSITVTVTGVVNASGAGGNSGDRGNNNGGGGGGGGSGGMIGLDGPQLTISGAVFANGGGGGGGYGGDGGLRGEPGTDPLVPTTAAPGGSGGDMGGGRGGAGSVAAMPGGNGGAGNQQFCAGGAGGGGAGVIRVFGAASVTGTVSPPHEPV